MEDLLSLKYRVLRLVDPPASILRAIEHELAHLQHEYNLEIKHATAEKDADQQTQVG